METTEAANDRQGRKTKTTTTTTSGTSSSSEAVDTKQHRDKRAKFIELANKRTAKALKAIRVIARLGGANASNYAYSQHDVDAISMAIRRELEDMERRMTPPGIQLDVEFDVTKAQTM